jgi:hypothetical protein
MMESGLVTIVKRVAERRYDLRRQARIRGV